MVGLLSRVKSTLKHGWNVFQDSNQNAVYNSYGQSYTSPNRVRYSYSNERSRIS
jgi:hypothetical protein